jgi:hypothetical protein
MVLVSRFIYHYMEHSLGMGDTGIVTKMTTMISFGLPVTSDNYHPAERVKSYQVTHTLPIIHIMSDIRTLYGTPPITPNIKIKPYHPSIPQAALDDLKRRLENAAEILTTYENSYGPEDPSMGVTKVWIDQAVGEWKNDYDW